MRRRAGKQAGDGVISPAVGARGLIRLCRRGRCGRFRVGDGGGRPKTATARAERVRRGTDPGANGAIVHIASRGMLCRGGVGGLCAARATQAGKRQTGLAGLQISDFADYGGRISEYLLKVQSDVN